MDQVELLRNSPSEAEHRSWARRGRTRYVARNPQLNFPSICKVTGGSLVHMSHERINDPGIELGTGTVFYHLYRFLCRPCLTIWSRANDGIEDVGNRNDATRSRDRPTLYPYRTPRSIPPP